VTLRFTLENQTALVTGAGKGIGRACVDTLAEAGARVIAVSRTQADLDALVERWGDQVETHRQDVCDASFPAWVESIAALDILVNNAGTNTPMPFTDVDDATLDRLLDINVRATFRTAQAAVRVMLKGGRGGAVINVTSQMGHVGSATRTVYCMAKHGVEGLTKAMAVELAASGIRVNSVAPTFINTPLAEPMLANPEFAAFVKKSIPLGRIGTVDDVAAAVLYLASPAAGMVTGHSLLVDGGWTAQ